MCVPSNDRGELHSACFKGLRVAAFSFVRETSHKASEPQCPYLGGRVGQKTLADSSGGISGGGVGRKGINKGWSPWAR